MGRPICLHVFPRPIHRLAPELQPASDPWRLFSLALVRQPGYLPGLKNHKYSEFFFKKFQKIESILKKPKIEKNSNFFKKGPNGAPRFFPSPIFVVTGSNVVHQRGQRIKYPLAAIHRPKNDEMARKRGCKGDWTHRLEQYLQYKLSETRQRGKNTGPGTDSKG